MVDGIYSFLKVSITNESIFQIFQIARILKMFIFFSNFYLNSTGYFQIIILCLYPEVGHFNECQHKALTSIFHPPFLQI